jgi:hypothetical protein
MVSRVELDELHDLSSGLGDALVVAVVLVPIQDELRRQDALTGDRRDVGDIPKRACLLHESNVAQVKEHRPEAATRAGEPALWHECGAVH